MMSAAPTLPSGGTAYDPRFQATWSSNGTVIELRRVRDCKVLCSGKPTFNFTNSTVSGLAVNDSRSRLYQLETIPGRFGIVVYDISRPTASCFKLLSKCIGNTLTQGGLACGLAYDESRDLLFIGTSEPVAIGGYDHYIVVADAKTPCRIMCKYKIPSCLSRTLLLSGLAYDCCPTRTLYVTDGKNNLELLSAGGTTSPCTFKVGRCCPAASPYRGLAVIPGWKLTHKGRSCLGKPCASCTSMYMRTSGGDPSVGNPAFSLDLVNAPGGSFGLLLLKGGPCGSGLPVFCGTLYAFPIGLGPFLAPITGSGCAGFAKFPLAIPPSPFLCHATLCAQYVVICPTKLGPVGIGLSDALEFTIAGS